MNEEKTIRPDKLPPKPKGESWQIDENGIITEEGPYKGYHVKFSNSMRRYIRHLSKE